MNAAGVLPVAELTMAPSSVWGWVLDGSSRPPATHAASAIGAAAASAGRAQRSNVLAGRIRASRGAGQHPGSGIRLARRPAGATRARL